MTKRRHQKPGTVDGLSGAHLGMVVRIAGVNYLLMAVHHSRRYVRILAEWDCPDDDVTCLQGDRTFPPGTPCTVVDWTRWFRPRQAWLTTQPSEQPENA